VNHLGLYPTPRDARERETSGGETERVLERERQREIERGRDEGRRRRSEGVSHKLRL
jgi:hypothetical protein